MVVMANAASHLLETNSAWSAFKDIQISEEIETTCMYRYEEFKPEYTHSFCFQSHRITISDIELLTAVVQLDLMCMLRRN